MEKELVIVVFQGLGRKELPAHFLLQVAKASVAGKMGGKMLVSFISSLEEFIQRWQVGIVVQKVNRRREVAIALSEKGGFPVRSEMSLSNM